MKKSIILFVFGLITMALQAQDNKVVSTDSIYFEKTKYDYGTIQQGANGDCEFKFINKGKVNLVLNDVKTSCGCTVPDWPRNAFKPGESGIIKVRYNTQTIGQFGKTITVYSTAANSPVVLQISGTVEAKK